MILVFIVAVHGTVVVCVHLCMHVSLFSLSSAGGLGNQELEEERFRSACPSPQSRSNYRRMISLDVIYVLHLTNKFSTEIFSLNSPL